MMSACRYTPIKNQNYADNQCAALKHDFIITYAVGFDKTKFKLDYGPDLPYNSGKQKNR